MAATPAPPTQTQYTSASLYVGDLHPDVTETHLFEHFHEIGSIVSIRVCRDNISRRSLGYAYVNFQNPMDAERALDTLNYSVLKGKPLRIMWRNSDPTLRKSGVGNIFIKNLDKSIDNQALHDTFSAFGNILSCKVATDETGKSKGYGFVHFETHDAAEKAINKVNNMRLGANTVYVGDFIRKSDRMRAIANKWTNVFFKNVDEGVAEDDLKTEFSKHGEVSSFVFNPAKVKGKGFGFVNYMTHDEASKAVEALNGAKTINGNETESSLFVGKAQKKEERQAMLKQQYEERRKERLEKFQGVNLYVKHLDDKVDEEQLKEEFKQFGTIQNVKIMRNDKGESRNFGFVCFKKPEEASKALAEMNGKMINEKPIYVALAQRKEVRRAQLQAQFAQRSAQYRMVPGMQPQMYPQVFYPGMQPRMVPFPPQAGMPVRRWDQPRPGKVARGGFAMAPSYAMAAGRGAPAGRRGAQNKGPKTNKKPQAPKTEGQDVIDPAVLASATPEEKRNILGSRLFAMVSAQIGADLAPKVTGVLLSMETPEVLHLMESQTDFTEVVNKAVEALSQAAEAQPAQEPEPEAQPAQ